MGNGYFGLTRYPPEHLGMARMSTHYPPIWVGMIPETHPTYPAISRVAKSGKKRLKGPHFSPLSREFYPIPEKVGKISGISCYPIPTRVLFVGLTGTHYLPVTPQQSGANTRYLPGWVGVIPKTHPTPKSSRVANPAPQASLFTPPFGISMD